jgi:YkoY family integral membrane protein
MLGVMTASMLVRYVLVFFMLVFLEGVLSADNALVMAVMVRPLAPSLRSKSLFYGLIFAVILRFCALLAVSFLANVWEAQAVGAAYLLYMAIRNLYNFNRKTDKGLEGSLDQLNDETSKNYLVSKKDFWWITLKINFADLAFAVDSILAAVAIALSLPKTGGTIGGMDAGQFIVTFAGGMCGVILMRFAAMLFVKLLDERPNLEKTAFLLVGWVGIKLVIVTMSHPALGILPETFPSSALWQVTFFGVMIAIALWGWFSSAPQKQSAAHAKEAK